MKHKKTITLLFGGQSAEHEVSIQSAKNVYNALDKEKYTVQLIGIDKGGNWHMFSDAEVFLSSTKGIQSLPALTNSAENTVVTAKQAQLSLVTTDVVFPLLHGPMGEDGTVQGLLRVLGIPFVGSDVIGSAVGMDKETQVFLLGILW
jgi:D-alanine-D-alanine ligase